jgi:adenosylmethionine-8-amino-7-oxononanoate aminotransferase
LGYHGSTFLAHALTGIQSTHIGFDLPIEGLIHHISAPYNYRRPEHISEENFCDYLVNELEDKIIELGAENVACFIAEPIMGAGGVIVPPKDYNYKTWQICKKYDVLYIADEVVTAFGRLGHMVASKEMFAVEPDMIVMAKGISSGYVPLGATMISDEIYDVISQPKKNNPYFSHGFTYSGHALACASGLINIEIMEKNNLCGHVQDLGPYFESQLQKLTQYPIVGEVRGSHFMLGIEFVQNKITKESFNPDIYDVTARIFEHCKALGFIVRPVGPIVVLSPPLTFDKEAIDRAIQILSKSIENVLVEIKLKTNL